METTETYILSWHTRYNLCPETSSHGAKIFTNMLLLIQFAVAKIVECEPEMVTVENHREVCMVTYPNPGKSAYDEEDVCEEFFIPKLAYINESLNNLARLFSRAAFYDFAIPFGGSDDTAPHCYLITVSRA